MEDDYRFSVAYDDNVVRVSTTGSFDYLKALQMWKEIMATCQQYQCFDILVNSRLAKPLPAPDLFNSGEFFDAVGLTARHRLAVVNNNKDVRESHKVAVAALKTRQAAAPFSAAAFSNERDARRWLSQQDETGRATNSLPGQQGAVAIVVSTQHLSSDQRYRR